MPTVTGADHTENPTMRMNRRNVLVGLGTIVTGGGAALGTGAFSSVEAERTMEIETDGDASALLALIPNDSLTSEAVSKTDGVLEINLGDSTNGANVDARTTIGKLDNISSPSSVTTAAFTITNNASNNVDVDVTVNLNSDQESETIEGDTSVLKLHTDVSSATNSTISGNEFGDITTDTLSLHPGESAEVVVQLDITGYDTSDINTDSPLIDSATITATQ